MVGGGRESDLGDGAGGGGADLGDGAGDERSGIKEACDLIGSSVVSLSV